MKTWYDKHAEELQRLYGEFVNGRDIPNFWEDDSVPPPPNFESALEAPQVGQSVEHAQT
jgi:hypothetical protein